MDAFEQLNEDLRTGQIDTETYVLFLQRQIVAALQKLQELQGLQQELQGVRQELETAQQRIAELERDSNQKPTSSPTAKVEQAYSMREEEKRQQKKQGKKRKHKLSKKGRRGRLTTADKIAVAERTEDCYPDGVPREDCKFSHTRVVWRLERGQAVLVAYKIYRGPNDQYGKPANVLGRSEFSLEIVVEVATLVYVMGLSFEKVCATLGFLQNLKLGKTQVDRLLHQLARHWRKEFEILCTLLANSLVAYADETSWSINSVWVFLSEKARILLYGVNKTAATLLALLDPKVFAGILISDDYAVYANFSKAQKCWAHLLRKAIKLTLEDPENEAYRGLTDELLDIYRQACRAKSDGRLGEAGRAGKVAALTERLEELCGDGLLETSGLTGAELDYRRLQNEIIRLSLRQQLFTFVTAAAVLQPNGESQEVAGTNNVTERENRNPAQAREMGRGNKSVPGARRQTIVVSVLASLRLYVTEYTLGNVVREILSWWQAGESCFAKLLQKMKLQVPEASVLDKVLPIPESS